MISQAGSGSSLGGKKIYHTVLESVFDGVYLVDIDRKITFWNKGAEEITGYSKEDVMDRRCSQDLLIHVDESGQSQCDKNCPLMNAFLTGGKSEREIFLKHKEGYRVPVTIKVQPILSEDGTVIGAIEVFRDDSSRNSLLNKLKEMEVMAEKALYDPLTELFNRRYISADIERRLDEMKRYNWCFGILFIDIDHFKEVNDTRGHDVGDKVLKMVAGTLQRNARPFDIIGRWGGEEFIGVIVNVDRKNLEEIAERLRSLIESSGFVRDGGTIRVTVSVGAVLAEKGDSVDSVIKRADMLMYKSKKEGRNRVSL